jgi:hypothetical protein
MKKIVFFFILISLLFNFSLGQDQTDKEKEAI